MISTLLLLPFLISVPSFSVGVYVIPHLLHNLWPSQQAVHIRLSNFLRKQNKKLPKKPQLAGALPRLHVGVGLPVCEHLCALGAHPCHRKQVLCVLATARWQDLAVTSSAGLIAHRIIFLKLVKLEIPMLVIVIAGLSR